MATMPELQSPMLAKLALELADAWVQHVYSPQHVPVSTVARYVNAREAIVRVFHPAYPFKLGGMSSDAKTRRKFVQDLGVEYTSRWPRCEGEYEQER
jgi:hypothetical protein